MYELDAVVGRWYQGVDSQLFEVVAIDEDADTVEIQYVGGDLGEVEADVWPQLNLVLMPPPDDWAGISSDLDNEGLGSNELSGRVFGWQSSSAVLGAED